MSESVAWQRDDFDPERDHPPVGAVVDHAGIKVRFDRENVWRIHAGPQDRLGGIARPFDPQGIVMSKMWVAQGKHVERGMVGKPIEE